jgi:hypothetical protein
VRPRGPRPPGSAEDALESGNEAAPEQAAFEWREADIRDE